MRTWAYTAVISTILFAVLTFLVYFAHDQVQAFDAWVGDMVTPLQTFTSIGFFLTVTALGSGIGIIIVAIGFTYLVRLSSAEVLRLIFLLLAVVGANRGIKDLIARTRPDALPWFDVLPSFAFPSAHATAILALYGFMAVSLYRRDRRLLLVLSVLVIVLVGLSRIVLNAHHASDVVGGYLLGLALLSIAFLLPFKQFVKRYG